MADGDAEAIGRVAPQAPTEFFFVSNQEDGEAQFPSSRHRPLDVDHRASIAPHRVKGYTSRHMYLPRRRERLGLLPFHDLAAAVVSAGRTGTMGKLPLMTVGAFNQIGDGEGIVGTTLSCPGIAVSPLRKWHP
jgi:hypothetical protein